MIPVNLRNYFPSRSMINFFSWIEAGYHFREGTRLKDVILYLKELFKKELVKENIDAKMSTLVRLERNPLLRAVPLEIKNLLLMAGNHIGRQKRHSCILKHGADPDAEGIRSLHRKVWVFTSTGILQLCSCNSEIARFAGIHLQACQ